MSIHALENFKKIDDIVKKVSNKVNIIAITKTFPLEIINPLIDYGHLDYGENRVKEAINKWSDLLKKKSKRFLEFHKKCCLFLINFVL